MYIAVTEKTKSLSTLSQKSATVAQNGETTATVAEFALFCDSVDRLLRMQPFTDSEYNTTLCTEIEDNQLNIIDDLNE